MPDYPDTFANSQEWTALPVPETAVAAQCAVAPIRITFKADPSTTRGFLLRPGDAVKIPEGATGFIRPDASLGGCLVIEELE